MPHIVVDDEQARLIVDSDEPVEILDRSGKRLGVVSAGFTYEELAEARRRASSDGPWLSTQEVLARLTKEAK